jgi:2-polyprenyl-3-methyl-5-hydroxy-6-metoxy-1,4-benzoquinol methylase
VARLGRFQVTGLDISHTMVEISKENAAAAGSPSTSAKEMPRRCRLQTAVST